MRKNNILTLKFGVKKLSTTHSLSMVRLSNHQDIPRKSAKQSLHVMVKLIGLKRSNEPQSAEQQKFGEYKLQAYIPRWRCNVMCALRDSSPQRKRTAHLLKIYQPLYVDATCIFLPCYSPPVCLSVCHVSDEL